MKLPFKPVVLNEIQPFINKSNYFVWKQWNVKLLLFKMIEVQLDKRPMLVGTLFQNARRVLKWRFPLIYVHLFISPWLSWNLSVHVCVGPQEFLYSAALWISVWLVLWCAESRTQRRHLNKLWPRTRSPTSTSLPSFDSFVFSLEA